KQLFCDAKAFALRLVEAAAVEDIHPVAWDVGLRRGGQIDSDNLGAAPLELEGPEAVEAGDLEDAHSAHVLRQAVQVALRAVIHEPWGGHAMWQVDRVIPLHAGDAVQDRAGLRGGWRGHLRQARGHTLPGSPVSTRVAVGCSLQTIECRSNQSGVRGTLANALRASSIHRDREFKTANADALFFY